MKSIKWLLATVVVAGIYTGQAQIKIGDKALGAIQNGMSSFSFSDADAAALAAEGIKKLDSANTIAGAKDGYTLRLNRVFGKHSNENGLALNYKVYLTKDINAFACADGSVRVYSGLMDIMDDNQLLAVIGHEIGHVANHDSRDAMKAAYRNAAITGAIGSTSSKAAAITDGQAGQIGQALLQSKYSRKQETEADTFSYDFMKSNGYDVNAVESAFNILASMSEGADSNFISQMMSSHPNSKARAEKARKRAEEDGVYKAYTQKSFSNKATTTKTTTKKKTTKKKK
jgi:putative metalloprotease